MFKKTTLPGGLRVISVPMPQVKSVAALVMVAAGSRYETAKNNGISHFLEHMIFKGTKKRPNSLAITSLVDGIGGSFNAFTDKETTGFYIKAAAEHRDLILDVLSDMLTNSLFDSREMNKERGVIIEEINMYEDQPQARVGELFEQLLYQNHPLARRISGEKKNILEISRRDMVDYVNTMYHTQSVVVGIAGGVGEQESKKVGKYFEEVTAGQENKFVVAKDQQTKPARLVHFKKTDQAHLCLGVRAYPADHPDRYVLGVLNNILGGNMSSRLFLQVREKRGLAYYVHSSAEEFHDVGYLVAQAGVSLPKAADAVKVIVEEFGKLTAKPVSAVELQRAKDNTEGKMVLALEDSFRVASFYTSQEVLLNKIETPEEILEKVNKVTAADIQRVARDIFQNKNLNLAIIGPFKNEGEFDKIIKL
ncbi:MAG: insulinase family protein [Patescibacteria group bacterium]|nr:insulinase family protein [Patescibacteria group bacterium]